MFLCCFPTFQGSGQKKAQSERCFCCCRCLLWRNRHHGCLLPSDKRQPQSSEEDVIEELADGFTYTINWNKGLEHQARNSFQCRSESSNEDIFEELVHGPHYTICQVRVQVHQAEVSCGAVSSTSLQTISTNGGCLPRMQPFHAAGHCRNSIQCAAELTLNLHEARRMRALQAGTLWRVAASLVPAFLAGNISHITTFMPSHPAFSRAQQFLDQLFTRSCPLSIRADVFHFRRLPPYNDQRDTSQDQIKNVDARCMEGNLPLTGAIASMMGTWPDQVWGFGQALHFPWFQLKQASVQVHFLASHCVACTHLVWIELENLQGHVRR
ncbi:ral guanine nucleotide dissociation stimulator-like [Pipistrellus kuhlii]|uniref:ral guanine nucleotide dissociation stimulator-like n=1 Tax=Pipistrellus kuhlii TaxID=59472 RepID=UPI00174F509E|nr:ral guanine nucleotide dissociation stimulator-like [Pipistrellus kuhlii]